MDIVEHRAKAVLAEHGLAVPSGIAVSAEPTVAQLHQEGLDGALVVKAQIASGGRGKAGGIRLVEDPAAAVAEARDLLGSTIAGHVVSEVLIEQQVDIAHELYAAVVIDTSGGTPMILFSPDGGVDIEDAMTPPVSMAFEPGSEPATLDIVALVSSTGYDTRLRGVAEAIGAMVAAFSATDAELVEVNPLVVTGDGQIMALDAKLSIDDSAADRQGALAAVAATADLTGLEATAAELGLRYIELDGTVGVLANGAGLTMTTMDVISHYGGSPANFLEIGGDSYTQAVPALELVLANPKVRSLVVNFCGAFARCDVMAGGVVDAWEQLGAELPIFFSIHGTGMDEARDIVRNRLGIEPFESMDEAIAAAVAAAT